MTAPGTQIDLQDQPPIRSAPTDVGVWFVAGLTEKGTIDPTVSPDGRQLAAVTSIAEFEAQFGSRALALFLWDALDVFFREGGYRAVVCRVTGPTPTRATVTLNDGGAVSSLIVTAKSYGSWGAALNVAVIAGDAGGEFKLVVTHDTDTSVNETSPSLVDQNAAVTWAQSSSYINVALGAGANDPAVIAAQSLTGGTDDRGNATDATYKAALDRAIRDLGPGMVSVPGRTTVQSQTDLLNHAAANGRVARIDLPDSPTKATVIAAAAALRSLTNARWGGAFWPWDIAPGIVAGTFRTVPPCARAAGTRARNLSLGVSPAQAAGGEFGQAVFITGLSQPAVVETDRSDYNEAGVDVSVVKNAGVRTYGNRTLVDPVAVPNWVELSAVDFVALVKARADVILEKYVLRMIDGHKHVISDLNGELVGMLLDYWPDGGLFGDTADEAFLVDTTTPNTPTTLANRELNANLALKVDPNAERVKLKLTKVPINQAL